MAEGGSVSGVGEMVGAPASESGDGARATSFVERAVLRRRLRFLRRRRELALHDLGGFVFEAHRQGQPLAELMREKLDAVAAIDDELAKLEHALDAREELTVLREPGVASCRQCGTIHDSGANFCPGCGRPAAPAAES
jgi:rubrerythrin